MRPHVCIEWSADVSILYRIPLVGANANLESIHPVDGVSQLLVAILCLIEPIRLVLIAYTEA